MNSPVEKNKHYTVDIVDIGTNGEGIGKVEGFTVFIPETVTGDQVEARITKVKKNFAFGELVELIKPAAIRKEPYCQVANICGGCQLQHITYEAQLEWKYKKVQDALQHIAGLKAVEVKPTLGMEEPLHYRNKVQYPIRKVGKQLQIGFFASQSHCVVPSDDCHIQDKRNKAITDKVKDFLIDFDIPIYNEENHKGLVRHLTIKTGYFTDEMMVILSINGKKLPHFKTFVERLCQIKGVTSIILSHTTENRSTALTSSLTVLYGKDYIVDKIGELSFKISPLAFFQVNPIQTKVLYEKVLEYADLQADEIVWDAYCGIGTISLFLAQKAKKVYGVEIVPEAIENAIENAKLNAIENTHFYVGKAEEIIPKLYKDGIKADTIVIDPPRKGCDKKLLETLIEMASKKIVYVSCDPATLARDLGYLCGKGYKIEEVQPVDMFPLTSHVETVVLLTKVEK